MRRAIAAVALLALLPNAHAQDKAKGELTHSAEFRLRDTWNMNQTAKKDITETSGKSVSANTLDQRFKLGLDFKATDKLSANLTLLNNFNWGQATSDTQVGVHNTGTEDLLSVNQAYANWMMSDEFSMKFGRMNYQIGDGSLIGINDWEAVPYSFEGLLANYEAEFGKIQFFTFKHREYTYTATTASTSDPELNSYGLNFDLKTMPEWLKGLNVHLI
jgi:hypothetical protein